ncbi:hypothetical protein AVEN_60311-1 [Araneus ventricosus]|uniref:Uncharacterized protein n=1 Tax=Araneus ventricosus TaxID=182803 RepID=A0A4Y2GU02_ARAVE|nr:hypothetical protein AVEN_60311-1 [Araneus ventricosus]
MDSVFGTIKKAKLSVVDFAAGWAASENRKINIYTDRLSSTLALQRVDTRSAFVNKVKANIFNAKDLVDLSWEKAHADIPGNELADQQSKLATTSRQNLEIPAPYSFLELEAANSAKGVWLQVSSSSSINFINSIDTGTSQTSLQAKDDGRPNIAAKFPPPFVKFD